MPESPWRSLFERVRGALHNRRDARGVVGSINWLRQGMAERGANPNVVRNIIYRDKGKLTDKRVLFGLLSELWESTGHPPLEVPEIERLLSAAPDQREALQLLGRDKRRIYEGFVGALRAGKRPKLLVTGRPGSGKTLLSDYLQEGLERAAQAPQNTTQSTPRSTPQLIRQEFSALNLADALLHLSLALGGTPQAFAAKLVKVGVAGAYSVQADAQAGVARVVLEQLRNRRDPVVPVVLLLHVSQSPSGQPSTLGDVPLRLNTPEVPRVSLTEWLWHTLLEPLSHLSQVALLVSMAELPLTLAGRTEAFEGPYKLSPPTTAEARRFVRTKAPQLSSEQQEKLLGQAKSSFENLRTLTLLAEAREPHGDTWDEDSSDNQDDSWREDQSNIHANVYGNVYGGERPNERPTEQLGQLVTNGSSRIRDFLEVLAVLSLPEFPAVDQRALEALRQTEPRTLSPLELAFLDAVPGEPGYWRPFARQFSQVLRDQLRAADPERFRNLSRAAGRLYEAEAHAAPRSDAAARYAYYLFAARAWPELTRWAEHAPVPQPLLQRLWQTAQVELNSELGGKPDSKPNSEPNSGADPTLSTVALRVASYYVRLGSPEHPDARSALEVLAASSRPELRSWALVKRAESALQEGRFGEAETLLDSWREVGGLGLATEVALLRANLARWHSRLSDAATHAQSSINALESAAGNAPGNATENAAENTGVPEPDGVATTGVDPLLTVRVGLWTGLVAKDRGEWTEALSHFRTAQTSDELFLARLRFQEADVLYSLGQLGEAHAALSDAVSWSTRGEAPAFERARYQARRGTLARRRGELGAAQADFTAAQTVLAGTELGPSSLRLSFEQAKVRDEGALNLLAAGRADDAITILQEDQETFAAYGQRYDVDPSFRMLRSRLRLAAAYGCRALAQRYGLLVGPYDDEPASPDLYRARQLLAEVLGTLAAEPGRYAGLITTARVSGGLLLLPSHAVPQAEAALTDARYPYGRGLAGAFYAGALLRRGNPGEAHAAVSEAQRELQGTTNGVIDDYALCAYLAVVDAAALLRLGKCSGAHERVFEALQNARLEPYHDPLLRHFGNAAEHLGVQLSAAALGLGDAPLPGTLRPADALALRWRQRVTPAAAKLEPSA